MSARSDLDELQDALASLTFDRLGTGWRRSTSLFVTLGVTARIERAVETGGSVVHTPPADFAEFEAWTALREAMTTPDHGTWFTGLLRLETSGAHRFEFGWDDEPRWPLLIDVDGNVLESIPVEDAELREDLLMHPRAAPLTPDWLVQRLGLTPLTFQDRWIDTLAPLAESQNWGIVRDMVRDTIQIIGDDSDPVFERDVVADGVGNELLGSTRANQLMRLLRDASAAGVIEEPYALRGDEGRASDEVLKEDDAFRRDVQILLRLVGEVADQEIANAVRA